MDVREYTDEEIIRGLEVYAERQCGKCVIKPLKRFCGSCFIDVIKQAPALIKRQKTVIDEKSNRLRDVLPIVAELKVEAAKEIFCDIECAVFRFFQETCYDYQLDNAISELKKKYTEGE